MFLKAIIIRRKKDRAARVKQFWCWRGGLNRANCQRSAIEARTRPYVCSNAIDAGKGRTRSWHCPWTVYVLDSRSET